MCPLILYIFLASWDIYSCHTIDAKSRYSDAEHVPITGGAIAASVVLLVSGIVLLMMCLDFCHKHSGFKDFDNDAFTDDSLPPVPMPASEFTMYPPIENTPDTVSASSPVVFEPLPDLTPENKHVVGNAWRLRPRVIHEGQNRSDSTDSLDEVAQNDSIQQKLKLQNLITNSRHQVPRGQLQYIKELGNGWFGKVLQGQGHDILPGHKKTKVVIQMLKEETDVHEQLAFLEEVASYRDTDHPNVLKLLGQCVDTEPYLNVLELCPFGDLKTYLRSHRVAMESFNEKGLLLKFACDMAAGLQALHLEGFVHRDFATRNCLLASDLSVKVGDYGISEEAFKDDYYIDRRGDAIPIRWLAPESLQVTPDDVIVRRITKEANIWTYGVSLWEVITFGTLPYSDLSNSHILRLVISEKSLKLGKPDIPVSHLDRLYQLLQLCWSEPEFRPSLRELRIMLLHLLSRRDNQNTAAFDLKWNQLMPRRSPRVTRARPAPPNNLPQVNGSAKMITGQATPGMSSAPSVLSGEDLDPSLDGLNASQLGLAGSDGVHAEGGRRHLQKPIEPTSPVNELSLEAEFSAVNVAAVNSNSERAETSDESKHQFGDEKMIPEDEYLTPIESDSEANDTDKHSTESSQKELTNASEGVPSVLSNDSARTGQTSDDFFTSTPYKSEGSSEAEHYFSLSSEPLASDGSQVTGTFHTVRSDYSSQSSIERSLSLEYEDRSFMGTKKFADLLQTVAMTASIDDDTSSEASPMPLDITEEEVFRSVTNPDMQSADIRPIGKCDLEDIGSGSGEDTPRNTPTPPADQNAAPLSESLNASTPVLDSPESTNSSLGTGMADVHRESVVQSNHNSTETEDRLSPDGQKAVEQSNSEAEYSSSEVE